VKWIHAIILALVLSGCASGGNRLLRDAAPAPADRINPLAVENPLVHPPWETLIKAGPGAENDLDLETLDGPYAVPPLPEVADAPLVPGEQKVAVVRKPEKPRQIRKPKPGDVVIKAVAVPKLSGPGGGELAVAMRNVLKGAGWPVKTKPAADALTVKGIVKISSPAAGQQIVEITWIVLRPDGKKLGDLKQKNAVPAGMLDGGWGENATFATEAAAEGLFKLIEKYR
jgi:hypothetical protein